MWLWLIEQTAPPVFFTQLKDAEIQVWKQSRKPAELTELTCVSSFPHQKASRWTNIQALWFHISTNRGFLRCVVQWILIWALQIDVCFISPLADWSDFLLTNSFDRKRKHGAQLFQSNSSIPIPYSTWPRYLSESASLLYSRWNLRYPEHAILFNNWPPSQQKDQLYMLYMIL